jgi:hypothetical protein
MAPTFITVLVDEHDELPDGCCMRFKLVDEPRPVRRVRYDGDGSLEGVFAVEAANADGTMGLAMGALVEDSGAGSSLLVYGGDRGLRLRREGGTREEGEGGAGRAGRAGREGLAEAYLLISSEAVLEWG